ncbi:ribosomal protein S18-alanine N-acetyltransferase [Wenzhouxiangella marina]|uniref:[Ribosomal protein bS18]-alanine N-acetyltransferase n=1 Tax=Wenzhouxiangella marina TaxID=1579979 RepID=A0A0K0XT45_9GAMM|nr:ribosomal protein S18-alanine N-acetyltransferase [Wenzhouxiangella marina]AKS40830.1 Alanine acetyltransferase [Wenzhouxiangella marina]MBB6087704.1 ribosomal-protein-alanine N-acetyltransferase [Wenzhouxiangella marina]
MVAVLSPEPFIREMRRQDIARVLAIEEASYEFPWTRGIFADCLRVGYRCKLLELEQSPAAYAIVSHALDEAHLLNLCVAGEFRRRGLARILLGQVIAEMRIVGAARLFLEVRPSNQGALRLYESMRFRRIGRRPGYYPAHEGREDALVMVHHLDEDGLESAD